MKQINCLFLLVGLFLFNCLPSVRADVLDNWTTNQVNTNSAALKHIVYANGHYVAVGQRGDEGDIYSSEDGVHWTLRYTDQNSWGLTIAYSSGRFVGVGGWETAISADSTNWTVSFLPSNYLDRQTDMTFGNSRYVVVGDTNNIGIIITSTDAQLGRHERRQRWAATFPASFIAAQNLSRLETTMATNTLRPRQRRLGRAAAFPEETKSVTATACILCR